MSYKIEINADSISELAGKLLALASQMQVTPTDPVMPEVKRATTKKPKEVVTEKAEEVVEEPVGEPSTPETSQPTPDTSSASEQPTTPPSSTTTSGAAPEQALDFEKDVTPLVLQAVKAKGKPWVQEVLSQFGVERASQVPDEQLGELVAILKDGI